ncbi:N-acetylmuramoyl-L-alanine amidase [Peribacillus sp. NJ4]|uniref:N-acetylmuramoyl-L-alanine amidase family protein n=1 Tax=Peribacillus sp. NJ4 TaxID=3055862 RepID=UPI00338DF483
MVLNIGLRIRNIHVNEYENVEVKMSRTTDIYRTLTERTDEANSWGANYFLSIHVNSYNEQAQG